VAWPHGDVSKGTGSGCNARHLLVAMVLQGPTVVRLSGEVSMASEAERIRRARSKLDAGIALVQQAVAILGEDSRVFRLTEDAQKAADEMTLGGVIPKTLTKAEQMQVGEELRRQGFVKSRRMVDGRRVTYWESPEEPRK